MDRKLETYHQFIQKTLTKYEEILNRRPPADLETVTVFDEQKGHYLLHSMGWQGARRVWNTIVYVRLRNGKFWVEEDGLEQGVATDLLEMGVPKEDIVLAFHHPKMRQYSEFAVG